MSAERFRDLDKCLDRVSVVEDCCRIEVHDEPRKPNKFNVLEDQILRCRTELVEEISDFNHQIKSTRGLVDSLDKKIDCLSKKIDISVS